MGSEAAPPRPQRFVIAQADLHQGPVAMQIHALAQAAYRVEAELIGCVDFPPLRESVEDMQRSADRFLVCQEAGRPDILGALSYDCRGNEVRISRLVVRPLHQRCGIATALHAELERRLPDMVRWSISTAQANVPALKLYQKLGYTLAETSVAAEGIALCHWVMTHSDRLTQQGH